ncbi:josephin-1-like isoform X2 [Octopus vulgaris]|uniref:Josephin-1-like isoform X2 n=1 Tax=Octopus vulgaris TaxID=6645 RepID=A0AA36BS02_OCTVU|nr:josephin-1-like isoform X2 [Octopus vulgaris]
MREIKGFVIHTCSRGGRGGHWLTIALIRRAFYKIDSLLPYVIKIGDQEALFTHLAEEIKNKRTMLFCLVNEGTVYDDSWMKELKIKERTTHFCDNRRKHWIEHKLGHPLRKSQKTMHIPPTSSGLSQNINDESDNSSENSQKGCNLL